jgi:hypothetical protein
MTWTDTPMAIIYTYIISVSRIINEDQDPDPIKKSGSATLLRFVRRPMKTDVSVTLDSSTINQLYCIF